MHQRKTYKYERPGLGQLVLDDLDNSHDTFTDLFSGVTMIVSAYPQHHDLKQQKRKEFMTGHMSLMVLVHYTVPGIMMLSQS